MDTQQVTLNKNICATGTVIPKDTVLTFDNNGTVVDITLDTAAVSSTALTVSGDMTVKGYGKDSVTSNFNVDNIISGGATSAISLVFVAASADGSCDVSGITPFSPPSNDIPAATTDGTALTAYTTIAGDFAGNTYDEVTLTYAIHADSAAPNGTDSNGWIEAGTVSGPAHPNAAKYWDDPGFGILNPILFTTNNNTTTSSVYKITIDISLANPTA